MIPVKGTEHVLLQNEFREFDWNLISKKDLFMTMLPLDHGKIYKYVFLVRKKYTYPVGLTTHFYETQKLQRLQLLSFEILE